MAEFGLFLGVSDHARDTSISRLKYPGQDATKLWSLFAQKLNWGERALLVSPSDQTATRIDDLLRRIGKQIRSGDRFVFYFAGHGLQRDKDQYLLLPNTDLNKLRRGLVAGNDVLSLDSLMDTVANWRGEAHSLFVLDCCRVSLEAPPGSRDGSRLSAEVEDVLAGLTRRDIGLRRSSGSGGGGASAAERFEHLSINVLNATGDKGQAYELDTLDGSVFATTWGRRIHAAVEQGRPYLVDAQEVEEGLAHDMFEALPDAYRDRPQRPFLSRPDQPFVIHRPAVATPSPSAPPSVADTGPSPQTSAQLELLAKAVLRGQAEDAPLALQAMGGLTDTARQALAQWAQAHGDTQAALAQAQAQVQALQVELAQMKAQEGRITDQHELEVARLNEPLAAAQQKVADLEAHITELNGQLIGLQRALRAAEQATQSADVAHQELKGRLTQATERSAQEELNFRAMQEALKEARKEIDQLQKRLAQRGGGQPAGYKPHEKLLSDLAKVKADLAEAQAKLTVSDPARPRRQRLQWSAAALAAGILVGGLSRGLLPLPSSTVVSADLAASAALAPSPQPLPAATVAKHGRASSRNQDGASAEQMRAWQTEAAQAVGVAVRFTDRLKDGGEPPEMVVIPGGRFTMGSSAAEREAVVGMGAKAEDLKDEEAKAGVVVKSFALGRTEVTRAQFAAFVKATGHKTEGGCYHWAEGAWKLDPERNWQSPGYEQGPNHPVVCVNHADAQAYAAWLTAQTGQTYRLPSEAEWELAARAGTTSWRYWGNDVQNKEACAYANVANASNYTNGAFACEDGHRYTAPVGSFKPNALGLVDVLGNANEWVEDCYHSSYAGLPMDGSAWVKECGSQRVLRGGSWDYNPQYLRSANRVRFTPDFRNFNSGFRIARTFSL